MRYIAHIITVSLKYFFDIDYLVYNHIHTIMHILAYNLGIFPAFIANEFYEGVLTVKNDAIAIRDNVLSLKERWDKSEMQEVLADISGREYQS